MFAGLLALLAAGLFLLSAGTSPLDLARGALVLVATFWLGWGAALALIGIGRGRYRPAESPFTGRAVVLVPIYNEDPVATFARIGAIEEDLRRAGLQDQAHIAILSDTRAEAIAVQELICFQRLVAETDGEGRIFYRRRMNNRGRKAGNIEDFIRRSGAAYDYAVVLDADSLMTAETIATMLRRMEAEPRLALLQSRPAIVGAESRFGRMVAFAASFYGPAFSRGLARLQGETGPFWGHNAVIRVAAFAQSCGLPELSGPPPFGGHVLSHDYVEAALLARAGWVVRLDADLGGTYEEGPENVIDFAKRDRRWCQGNLQHARILFAPRLQPWSRFVFVQGIFAYLSPVLWLAFMALTLVAAATETDAGGAVGEAGVGLAVLVVTLLVAPKILVALNQRVPRAFGGRRLSGASVAGELVLSSLLAPVLLMFQVRSVLQVLMGIDGGWPAQSRGDGRLRWSEALRATWWIIAWGVAGLALTAATAAQLLPWLLPVALPMLLAPALVVWSSRPSASLAFSTPEELVTPAIARRAALIGARWSEGEVRPREFPTLAPALQQVRHV
jgi:membrane glycosyltransferase